MRHILTSTRLVLVMIHMTSLKPTHSFSTYSFGTLAKPIQRL